MNIFSSQNTEGDLWLRKLDGKIESAVNSLSAVYTKYKPISNSFYDELTNNLVTRFDMIYDNIFLETQSGFIFDKIKIEDGGNILPYHNVNNFKFRQQTAIDYWFDELNFKIYFIEIKTPIQEVDLFNFNIILNEYDCNNGLIKVVLKKNIIISLQGSVDWGGDLANIETPKICYNKDTKNYNISFILRNNLNRVGIISLSLSNKGGFNLDKINGLIPYANGFSLFKDEDII